MAAISNPDTAQRQKAMEGLRELARMIAAAYRRRVTGEAGTAFTAFGSGEENTALCTGLEDLRHEGSYTEIVKVDNFIRRKVPQVTNSRN
jgi:hypothetical protein